MYFDQLFILKYRKHCSGSGIVVKDRYSNILTQLRIVIMKTTGVMLKPGCFDFMNVVIQDFLTFNGS